MSRIAFIIFIGTNWVALLYITFPGFKVSQRDPRMWNVSYKYYKIMRHIFSNENCGDRETAVAIKRL